MPEEKHQEGVSVHTGFPNPAIDKSMPTLDFNQLLIEHAASTYMFRIEGSEWESVGVFGGDIAIVDRALDPRKADVVIWWNEESGDFAISKYSAMPKEARLWGVVTASIHQFRIRNKNQAK